MATSPLYRTFETDKNVEQNGLVLEFMPNSKGEMMSMRIRRAGGSNTTFAKVLEHKMRPVKRQSDAGMLPNEQQEAILREVYAEAVVIGMDNFEDRDCNPLPFNKANVIKVFTDLPDLFRDVVEQSQKAALFRQEVRESEAGN